MLNFWVTLINGKQNKLSLISYKILKIQYDSEAGMRIWEKQSGRYFAGSLSDTTQNQFIVSLVQGPEGRPTQNIITACINFVSKNIQDYRIG